MERSFDCARISDLMYFMGVKRAPLRMLSPQVRNVSYKSIHGLFRIPDVSPFSEDYLVYSATSGIEFIVNEMRANSSLK